jgi:hypothetical protein
LEVGEQTQQALAETQAMQDQPNQSLVVLAHPQALLATLEVLHQDPTWVQGALVPEEVLQQVISIPMVAQVGKVLVTKNKTHI